MKHKPGANNSPCNIISLKNYKNKRVKKVSSTIAAIIAIRIEHPSNITPEDFFVNEIEAAENIEVLAFEDALDNNNMFLSSIDAQNSASNDA